MTYLVFAINLVITLILVSDIKCEYLLVKIEEGYQPPPIIPQVYSTIPPTKRPVTTLGPGWYNDIILRLFIGYFKTSFQRLVYSFLYHSLVFCCQAIIAECEACNNNMTVEEYCKKHPKTQGCKEGKTFILKVEIVVDH